MRMIDADDLLTKRPFAICGGDLSEYDEGYLDAIADAVEAVKHAPAIDPESLRPRARWLGEIVLVNGTMSQECSHCHRIRPIDDFCAACGAKMEGDAQL